MDLLGKTVGGLGGSLGGRELSGFWKRPPGFSPIASATASVRLVGTAGGGSDFSFEDAAGGCEGNWSDGGLLKAGGAIELCASFGESIVGL